MQPAMPLASLLRQLAEATRLAAMTLAWMALSSGTRRISSALIWVFNIWGLADLLLAYYQGAIGVGIVPASLGAAWFIPTVAVPLLLWTHVLVFASLLRSSKLSRR